MLELLRQQFPNLQHQINQHPLIYFDNAASTQLPNVVIQRMHDYYTHQHANVHRGSHFLSDNATAAFEQARLTAQHFLNAQSSDEIIWTQGTTDGLNLLSQVLYPSCIQQGDTIVVSGFEHHANLVPWQQLAQRHQCKLLVIPVTEEGVLDLDHLRQHLTTRCRLFAINHVSNVTGAIQPLSQLFALARQCGACIVIDGAQAAAHIPVDVQALDCDFYVFSGHKVYGPTGIGVLYGKQALLSELPPYRFGGEMVRHVSYQNATFQSLPFRFEAGTPNISSAIGLGCALDFLMQQRQQWPLEQHEQQCAIYLKQQLQQLPDVQLLPSTEQHIALQSFTVKEINSLDIACLLDQQGIALRCGQHCAMPLHQALQRDTSLRASLAMYNTCTEIDAFIKALHKTILMLKDS